MDEISDRIGLRPTPLTWPVGIAGDFRGVLRPAPRRATSASPAPPAAPRIAPEERLDRRRAAERARATPGRPPSRSTSCSRPTAPTTTRSCSSPGTTTPVLFASALLELRRRRSCSTRWSTWRPPPAPRAGRRRAAPRALDRRRSARSCSRCRPAWTPPTATGSRSSGSARASSSAAWSSPTRRPAGRSPRSTPRPCSAASAPPSTTAYPGDVIGLVNADGLRRRRHALRRRAGRVPADRRRFAPEHFAVAARQDTGRYKQFRRGIEQLDTEGVVQVLRSDLRGDQAPVLAAVGPMQFEVVAAPDGARVQRARSGWSGSPTRWPGAPTRRRRRDARRPARRRGAGSAATARCSALFTDKWRLQRDPARQPRPDARAAARRRAVTAVQGDGVAGGPHPAQLFGSVV